MKNGVLKKVGLLILPRVCSWLIKLWFRTCRIREHGGQYMDEAENRGKPLIGICWHYCVLGIFAFYRNRPLVLMISSSNDGDYLAEMAKRMGFAVVRGSRNRRGAPAAREMIRELRQGRNIGLVADGSQGPARIAQPGPVLLASKGDAAIIPMLYSASSYFSFNSWDKLILPRPFSSIDIFYGEPQVVPVDIQSGEIEKYRCILEERLNLLYAEAWQMRGKSQH